MSTQQVKITTETLERYFDIDATVHVFDNNRSLAVKALEVKVGQYLSYVDERGDPHLSKVIDVTALDSSSTLWLHTDQHGLLCMESHAPVVVLTDTGPLNATAGKLKPGDKVVLSGADGTPEIIPIRKVSETLEPLPFTDTHDDHDDHHHGLPAIEDKLTAYKSSLRTTPQPEKELPNMSDANTAVLEQRIATLEETLIATNEVVTALQRSIVELTADHMQRIFSDEIMIDTIAHRIMAAGANAIAYKAKSSKQRAPELVVVEGYVPGSVRVTLKEDQVLIEEQVAETQEWVSGDQLSEAMQKHEVQHVFGDLLIAYGAAFDRPYYVVDSVVLEEFRANTAKQAAAVVKGVEEAGAAGTESAE